MFATCNLPGSTHFTFFHGTKKECKEWLNHFRNNEPYHVWQGGHLITNREAKAIKYRDGSKVFYNWDGTVKR